VATTTIVRRSGAKHLVKIDSDDVPKVCGFRWHVMTGRQGGAYVATNDCKGTGGKLLLHRVANGTPHDLQCDILSGDNFDCRKFNLRDGEGS
jgi:hypothetical protein